MREDGLDDRPDPRALLDPLADRAQRVAEPRHAELHTGPDSVGSWPPRTQSWPSRTWYSYS